MNVDDDADRLKLYATVEEALREFDELCAARPLLSLPLPTLTDAEYAALLDEAEERVRVVEQRKISFDARHPRGKPREN